MSRHLSADVVELYVIGALDTSSSLEVDRHVEGCARCARLLAGEARLELALIEVARAPVPLRARRRVGLVAAGLALAAAGVVAVVGVDRTGVEAIPRVVRCADHRGAPDCIAKAQFEGVLTIGPDNQLVVPRYEEGLP